jgi:major cell surface glycoprotein (TIGR04216 family)
MTDYNDKMRAVILAALMVFSVFAGTVAFSGSAAAAQGTPELSSEQLSPTTVGQNEIQHDVSFNVSDYSTGGPTDGTTAIQISAGSISSVSLDVDNADTGADVTTVTSRSNSTTVDITTTDVRNLSVSGTVTVDWSGVSAGDETVSISAHDTASSSSGAPDAITPVTVTVSDTTTRSAPGSGGGIVYDGATLFQGEEDIRFSNQSSLTGSSGDAEGQTLTIPIDPDQPTGQYDTNGPDTSPSPFAVTLLEPRITQFDINNANGADISGGSVPQGDSNSGAGELTVDAHYNYDEAEDLELTVENEGGLDVTGDALTSGETAVKSGYDVSPKGELEWDVDLSDLNTGTFTFEVAGEDDLDFGRAVQSTTVTVTGDDDVTLDLDQETATQGEDVTYTIRGSNAEDHHYVAISGDDVRNPSDPVNASRVFRNVGDVNSIGVYDTSASATNRFRYRGSAPSYNSTAPTVSGMGNIATDDIMFANVTIDDDTGVGVGQIDTSYLDTNDVDVEVYAQADFAAGQNIPPFSGLNPDDDPSLEVEEGDVSIDTPGNTYVVGSEITINGSTSQGVDDVAFYVRRNNNYELVDLDSSSGDGVGDAVLSVDADDTFEKEDVILSQGDSGGNDFLSLPGTYRFGVVAAEDVPGSVTQNTTVTDGGVTIANEINVSTFNTGTSAQQSLRVTDTELSATVRTVGGQVADTDDRLNISGTALGNQDVGVIFVDERGNTDFTTISVDDDNTFDEDEVQISGLDTGQVSVHVVTPGRDNQFGDGSISAVTTTDDEPYNNIQSFVNYLGGQSLTGDQVRSRILDQTTEETASDDRMVTSRFRYADPQSQIQNVYPEGMEASGLNPVGVDDTMVVEGTTNLRPDDNAITVELMTDGGESVALSTTDSWSYDGTWTVSLPLEDVQTGTYTLEAEGENTDTVDVEIVQNVQTATPEPTDTPEPTATDTPTPEPTATDTPEPTDTATPEPTDTATPTSEGGPGFGAIVAVLALLAAALLATRRDD